MNKIILLLVLSILPTIAFGQAPDIGDNSIYACVESRTDSVCRGRISWLSNPVTGVTKSGRIIRLNRARLLARRYTRRFRVLRNRAERDGDSIAAENFERLRLNAVQSRRNARICTQYRCSLTGAPPASQACEIAANPKAGTALLSSLNLAEIVNGAVCSTAQNSPAVFVRQNSFPHCTGSLVKANVVITAAHCVEGVSCRSLTVENFGRATRSVSNCIINPLYQGEDTHDVAILILESNLDNTNIVKLHTSNDIQIGERVILAGYGRNEDNDQNLRATSNTVSRNGDTIETIFNVGDINEGTTCNGDSGGPLYLFRDNQWVLVGGTSTGTAPNCALPGNESRDISSWANLTTASNLSFIANNTEGVID